MMWSTWNFLSDLVQWPHLPFWMVSKPSMSSAVYEPAEPCFKALRLASLARRFSGLFFCHSASTTLILSRLADR